MLLRRAILLFDIAIADFSLFCLSPADADDTLPFIFRRYADVMPLCCHAAADAAMRVTRDACYAAACYDSEILRAAC